MPCPKCNHHPVQMHGALSRFRRQCQTCQHIFYPPMLKPIGWLVGILLFLGLSPWWANKALQLIISQPDTGESADAIVVLGRGHTSTEYRTAAATQLWKDGRAPQIFFSGAYDAPILMDLAQEMGIPEAHINGEGCSASTWENAFYTEMLMPVDEAKPKIFLVTDDLHIARSTLIYRSFGFEVIPYPVQLKFPVWRQHILREFLAFAHYVHKGKLKPPTPERYAYAQSIADTRIPEWQCIYTDNADVSEP